MKKIIFTFLFSILLLGGQDIFSQVRKPVVKPVFTPMPEEKIIVPTPKGAIILMPEEAKCFFEKSFDTGANVLPSNYHGNDLRELIYEMIRREKLTKDEFETTKQFIERVENEKKKNFLGELNSNSLLSFEIYGGDFKYDADNESMNFEILLSSLISWTSPCQTEKRYIGPRISYKLFVESMDKNSFPLNLNFKIDLERAKKAKPNLRILAVGKIKESSNKFYTEQSDYIFKQYTLNFSLEEIWVYELLTGKIFLKYKPDFEVLREEAKKLSEVGGRKFLEIKKLYENGRDDEAIIILKSRIASEPTDARACFWLGKIYYRQEDFEQAISSLKTAVFWDNHLIDAHILLGKIYLNKGDCLQAKNYLTSALAIDAENQDAKDLQKQVEKCRKY